MTPAQAATSPAIGHTLKRAVVERLGSTLGERCIHPWHVTMWLLRQRAAGQSLHEIGRLAGHRSASETRTGIAVVDALMSRDSTMAAAIVALLPDVPPLGPPVDRERRRARQNAHTKTRDYIVLAAMRRAEAAAQPPHKQPSDRACLGCGKVFASKWCGNRMCEVCKDML
jgi:hypothetical protein